ncbi:hypothetical protein JXA59_03190 [Patescibacteria group bacterium]|nr:hypothetical protein [Patescibacteria group bacterium]
MKPLPENIRDMNAGDYLSTVESTPEHIEQREFTVSPELCGGHFEKGPKIVPAFRILEGLFKKGPRSLPSTVEMKISDTLPLGTKGTITKYAPDHLTHTSRSVVVRQNGNKDGIDITAEWTNLNDQRWFSEPSVWKPTIICQDAELVVADSSDIERIRPQGPEIIMIDRVINPTGHTHISEAVHRVTTADFLKGRGTCGDDLSPQTGEYHIFNNARTLEGIGQLAYIYFQKHSPTEQPQIPFFTKVEAVYNHNYRPAINEPIHYQLLDFSRERNRGAITGRVLAGDHQTILALYRAEVGIMATSMMERVIQKITAQSDKTEPNQI